MKLERFITSYTKINSKYIINLKAKTTEEQNKTKNMQVNLCDLGLDNDLLVMIPKA